MKVHIKHYDYDPDLVWEKDVTEEQAFCYMAEDALCYLEENDDFGQEKRGVIERVVAAIKAESWQQLLGPVNEFLRDFNGEYYEVTPIGGEASSVPSDIADIRKRVEAINVDAKIYAEN